jgi:predicted lactoylglutathione lyase
MHDNVNNVVHVEDHAVTWGQFFQNLGWNMGPTYIINKDGTIYQENGNNKLNLILNGQDYTDFGGLQNTVINDKDKLLVSFGDESQSTLKQEYNAISSTAKHYDETPDPASCSGSHETVLHTTVWFTCSNSEAKSQKSAFGF